MIKVLNIDEQNDGSAIVEIEASQEYIRLLIEKGFVSLLKEYIDSVENEKDNVLYDTEPIYTGILFDEYGEYDLFIDQKASNPTYMSMSWYEAEQFVYELSKSYDLPTMTELVFLQYFIPKNTYWTKESCEDNRYARVLDTKVPQKRDIDKLRTAMVLPVKRVRR